MEKLTLSLALFVIFFGFNLAHADVIINEVQIAGSTADDEFIELYNSGDLVADLTGFYIKKKTSTGSSSDFVVPSRFEGITISGGSYLLLARTDKYTGAASPDLFWPSSYSLANNNSLALYRGNEIDKDEVNWETIGENKSIQKTTSGSWITATPTPGLLNQETVANEESDSGNTNDQNTDTNSSSSNSSGNASGGSVAPKKIEEQKINVKIIGKTIAFTGIAFSLQAQAHGYNGEQLSYGKYFWNFGDGDSREIKDSMSFMHTYFYAGEYPVFLEYYANYYSLVPDATAKIIIKVVPMTVSISNVGDVNDFFIELSNNTDYEIDISKWILSSLEKKFILPKNTVILVKKKIILSPKITNFTFADAKNLKLSTLEGQLVFDYGSSLLLNTVSVIKSINPTPKTSKASSILPTKKIKTIEQNNTNELQISDESLSASAISSNIGLSEENKKSYPYLPIFTSFVFIGTSAGVVYFIRKKKTVSSVSSLGDDFAILDE